MTVMDPPAYFDTGEEAGTVSTTSPSLIAGNEDRIVQEMVEDDRRTRNMVRDIRKARRQQIDPIRWIVRKLFRISR